jgi:hypothetical protein
MKKLTLLLGAAFLLGTASYAGDGAKSCCKKEGCTKEKKEACGKGKDCCKKCEKTASTKDTKTTTPKKS